MWYDIKTNNPVMELSYFPKDSIGFVYLLEYADGSMYIGKKNLYSTRTLPKLKTKNRDNAVVIKKRKDGHLVEYEIVTTESDWLDYEGSTRKGTKVAKKYILGVATSKIQLTYLETKYLFKYNAIIDANFINDNILGKFYRGRV